MTSPPRTLDTKVMSNMLQMVRMRAPEGIQLIDILLEYKLRFGVYLNVSKMGLKSIYELCERITDWCHNSLTIMDRRTHHIKTELIFFDQNRYMNWLNAEQNARNFWLIEQLVSISLPEDIVFQGSCNPLPKLSLPANTFHNKFVKFSLAKINFVVLPFEIYLHLRGPHYDIAYKRLRQSLRFYDAYYGNSDEKYLMPPELAVADYYCVVRNPEDHYSWHRARILSNDNGNVTLFAIDYGNTITDTVDELRLMKMDFFQYPALAIRVSLAGIEPKGGVWCDASTVLIRSFVAKFTHEHYLVCTFLQQFSDDSYSVLIGDVVHQENKVVFIHEELVRRDLAFVLDPNSVPIKCEKILYEYSDEIQCLKSSDKTNEYCFNYELNNNNNIHLRSIVNEVKQNVSTINENLVLPTFDDNNISDIKYDIRNKYFSIQRKIVHKKMYFPFDNCAKKVYQQSKYFPNEKFVEHKKKYFEHEKVVEHQTKYFPNDKVVEYKNKYFPIESVIERKPKYLTTEMLLPVDQRRRYLSSNDKICDYSHNTNYSVKK